MIEVAGIQVPRSAMIDLAHRLVVSGENNTAARILDGLARRERITLEIADRKAILAELDYPPPGLAQLRDVLIRIDPLEAQRPLET